MDKEPNKSLKDINQIDESQKPSSEAVVDFILAKNEKLVSAIYMITALLSDNEPLKWKLRELSLTLLSDLPLSLIGSTNRGYGRRVSYEYANLEQSLLLIDDILSLIKVALSGGSVSQMNFTILNQEYQKLREAIAENFSPRNFSNFLLADAGQFLTGEGALAPWAKRAQGQANSYRPNLDSSQIPSLSETNETRSEGNYKRPNRSSDNSNQITDLKHKDHNPSQPKSEDRLNVSKTQAGEMAKTKRQQQIISYLQNRSWTSIKDIARQISDCSSKTVQRELVEMVEKNVLKKTGERRWSRYMLA